ncbi:hypothetical protein GOODEAATRI_022793 [Goodea atripinnis]|uniref:Uncharacterized protein n=1 Tax=Goodea atripinnis TaxID=208336 RepID=A0ABV0N3L2_9TELE
MSSIQSVCPVSCLHSGDHLRSSKNITNRTNQALQFTMQLLPVPDALLASHGLPFSDKLCSPARSLSNAAHGLIDLDPRSKSSRNKQVPALTSTNPGLAPAY